MNLRQHQIDCINHVHNAIFDGERRMVVQAPTGAGKTRIACEFINDAIAEGKRVIFTVPKLTLISQTLEAFRDNGVDLSKVGVMQAMHELTNWDMPVQLCSVQTLNRRNIPPADIVFIDECHVWSKLYQRWFLDPAWQNVPIIGLTATPWAVWMGRYFHRLIIATNTRELIREGILSDFRVYAPYSPDLRGVRITAGDYNEAELAQVMGENRLVANVIDTWLKLGQGRPTLCFAVDCAHAKHLQAEFIRAGVSCDYQDAFTDENERLAIKRRFHSGESKIVCNVGTLTTGVDWDVRCIIVARPTRSEILHVQIIGRGLRQASGKDHCLILDHSDNHIRLGFVTDIFHNQLRTERPPVTQQPRVPLPKPCFNCHAVLPPRTKQCPACGYIHQPPDGRIAYADGELVELPQRHDPKQKPKVGDILRGYGQSRVYSMLNTYARSHAYKSGWVAHKFRVLFGDWPRLLADTGEEPTPTLRSWLRSQNIAYAKTSRRGD